MNKEEYAWFMIALWAAFTVLVFISVRALYIKQEAETRKYNKIKEDYMKLYITYFKRVDEPMLNPTIEQMHNAIKEANHSKK
jgi:hypothetical protein